VPFGALALVLNQQQKNKACDILNEKIKANQIDIKSETLNKISVFIFQNKVYYE